MPFSTKLLKTVLIIGATLSLSACEAMDTAFDRVGGAFDSVVDSTSAPATERLRGDAVSAFSNKCPRIKIVEELSALNEFTDPNKPSEKNLISHVKMRQADASCDIKDNNVSVDIKLAFDSKLGKKAKIHQSDKPFFSYPFFVAITDIRGNIMAKEVFAASMTYDRNQDAHTYIENIRQIIPLESHRSSSNHRIYIGFQLSDEQLSYNRETMAPPPLTAPEESTNAPEALHPNL